ncbi:hypothetical protein V5799_009601 [Amblyomma americanum]|uniref:Uncharacterized protein n=1 Tax=Amblyomma americanum TaxID=6943 RepID=A0AAQ4F9W5_AMBAM
MGLLLAAESAISLFSAAEREHAERLLQLFMRAAGKFVRLLPWSEKVHDFLDSTITGMKLVYWPENLESMDNALSVMYKDFVDPMNDSQSFFGYWIHASKVLQTLDDRSYYLLQIRWRFQHRRFFEYYYWSNEMLVSHAALAGPLYYASQAAVLRAATFGGFGSNFLSSVLRVVNMAAFKAQEESDMETLLSPEGIKLISTCGSAYDDRIKHIVAVMAAWNLFKNVAWTPLDHNTSQVTLGGRTFAAEQVFFIAYCRSLCEVSAGNLCTDVLSKVRAFAATFKCKVGAHMHSLDRCGVVEDFENRLQNESMGSIF